MRRVGLIAAVLALFISGCESQRADGPAGSAGGPSQAAAVIGVSVLTFANPFFHEIAAAVTEEAATHGYSVIVADGENDPVKQDQQVDDFITKQVDAIILCPCDSRAVGASIVKANRAGIPVFTADIASLADQGEVVCHVATDNYGGGKAAGEAVIEAIGGKGKVAVIDFPMVESVIQRTTGFHEVVDKLPEINVAATLPGGGEKRQSSEAAEDILQTHPDLNAFFCINDPSALGVITAVEKAGKSAQIKIIGFDAQPEARRAVAEGRLYATIVQYPDKIGRTVADAVHKHLTGQEVEAEILIPVSIYRKTDADNDPTLKSGG